MLSDHSEYTSPHLATIATINKSLLNKDLSLSIIHCGFKLKFPKHFLLRSLFDHKKIGPLLSVSFHKMSLIMACCSFGRFKFRTLTPKQI